MARMHLSHISNFQKNNPFLADHLRSSQLLIKAYITCHQHSFVHLLPINFVHHNIRLFKDVEEAWHVMWVIYGNQECDLTLIYIKMTGNYAPQIQISLWLFKLHCINTKHFLSEEQKNSGGKNIITKWKSSLVEAM